MKHFNQHFIAKAKTNFKFGVVKEIIFNQLKVNQHEVVFSSFFFLRELTQNDPLFTFSRTSFKN
jgi:hypothetical protein